METKKSEVLRHPIIITLAGLLAVIIAAIVLGLTGQIARWVAWTCGIVALGHICFLMGWGAAKHGWGWRV